MLDAVTRTMRRMFVTRQKLLEWETAAEAEIGARKRTPVDRYLDANVWVAVAIAVLLVAVRPEALMVAGPVLLLWGLLKPMCAWLNGPPVGFAPRRAQARPDFPPRRRAAHVALLPRSLRAVGALAGARQRAGRTRRWLGTRYRPPISACC